MMSYTAQERDEFLRESNAIEGVYDERSLAQAEKAWTYLMKRATLDLGVILKIHRILMLHMDLEDSQKGAFRTVPVWIGSSNCPTLHHELIRTALQGWCIGMNFGKSSKEDWKKLHVEYESIHPFVDGNGRTGRMFMNWYRLRHGLPLLIIKADERQEYYKWFR